MYKLNNNFYIDILKFKFTSFINKINAKIFYMII